MITIHSVKIPEGMQEKLGKEKSNKMMTYGIGMGSGMGKRMIFFFFFLGLNAMISGRNFLSFFSMIFFLSFPSHGLMYSDTRIRFNRMIKRNVNAVFWPLSRAIFVNYDGVMMVMRMMMLGVDERILLSILQDSNCSDI